ncbi:endo-1,4-beta-xylanase xylA, putative (macronuclear) [Tetrahymena thermophila SB210]|uniref:Endo-1,4-beta-xylanase xylA, putative n=1 Tax=Tetrahymena thermophila (strain SB210) TaxID=312017 RepID=I7MGV6_TETTS|nr:endo-1,4-beta-xylanase xylA, putative [Tetrahymena thermophila SB210]EAR85504.2 endo-1,4-beta-xylanase xylA, putative [Tetrahymena thermophila SB210]|eukprot:XP_001033167.2 endo-1,4-beta-xylanase xylA, putative [Tetrahymena thermophila SB210]
MSVKGSNNSFHNPQNQQQGQEKDENQNIRQNSVVHFANDIPLVVVEIPLNGKIAKLPIFEFSSPDNLASQFCRKYQLDEKLKKPIKKMIEKQMQEALKAKSKQNSIDSADNHQNNKKLQKSQSTVQISQNQNQQNYMPQQLADNQLNQRDNYQGKYINNLNEQNINNEEYREEQKASKNNFSSSNRNYNKNEQHLGENQNELQQNNKKHKVQIQPDHQIKNAENQHQSFQKLKHKDFFTENSETENELSDVADLRKPAIKPVKNINQANFQQKTLQKNKQSQSSAQLLREQNYEMKEKEQPYQQSTFQDTQQSRNSNRYENTPNIITQQTQTRSILKQNKSQENLFKNNEFLNAQDQRQVHKNLQSQNDSNSNIKDNIQRSDNSRYLKSNNQEEVSLNNRQQQIVHLNPKINDQVEEEKEETFQIQKNKKVQNITRGSQKEIIQNDRKQQNIYEIHNQNLINKVVEQQVYKNTLKNDQESAQFTFNEDESNDNEDPIQNRDFKIKRDINQNEKLIHNQHFKNSKQNLDSHQNNIHKKDSDSDEVSQNQTNKNFNKQQQSQEVKSNISVNQEKPKQNINQKQEKMIYQDTQEMNQNENEEEDTEVDELQKIQKQNKQNTLLNQNKNLQNQFTKNKKIQNKNNEEFQNYDQINNQDSYENTENDNDHFNQVDEAQDLVQNPQLLNLLSKPIKRAPNGVLQRQQKNAIAEGNENHNLKAKPFVQNKIKDDTFNSNNVFNIITLDQQNEVSDFVSDNLKAINQGLAQQNQPQAIQINPNSNNAISPQSYMSPPPQRYLSPSSNSNFSNTQQIQQPNIYMSPKTQFQQNVYRQANNAIPQDNNNFFTTQNNNINQQVNRQINPQHPSEFYQNNQNQIPYYQNQMLSPLNKNYQGLNYQENTFYQNQVYQQNLSSPHQQNKFNQFPPNNQNIANLPLNQSFLSSNNNNTINTSINGSLINKSFTPRRKIFEENNQFFRNQPILPQNIIYDQRINEQQYQQQYVTPIKNGSSTPMRYRNQENTQFQQQQRQQFIYPSRSISPNGNNNYINKNFSYQQQLPLNQQSLQFTSSSQANYNRNGFVNQSNLQNIPKINTPFQQQVFEQQQQQNFITQQHQIQNNQMIVQQQPQQVYGQAPQYLQQNQNQISQPIYKQNFQNNTIENQSKSPRSQVALPQDQRAYKNNNHFQGNTEVYQKSLDTPSPNFAPDIEKSTQKSNIQSNNGNRSPSPTQIKSANNNFNYKNLNIPLFEKIKLQQQEQFKQMGLDNNMQQTSQNASNIIAIQPTSVISTDKIGGEKVNNQLTQQYHKNLVQQKDYYVIDDIKSSGIREEDIFESNQQNVSQRTSVKIDESEHIQNGILFSLNANYQEKKQSINSNIKELFSLLDSKNQGWISQQQIDFSKLPPHFQLRLELNQLLEELFQQFKTVDIDSFSGIITSKYPQVMQHCNTIFNTTKSQNNILPQQQIRPPSFGLSKDTPVFQ